MSDRSVMTAARVAEIRQDAEEEAEGLEPGYWQDTIFELLNAVKDGWELLTAERQAREAAEQERDAARAAIRDYINRYGHNANGEPRPSFDPLRAVLASAGEQPATSSSQEDSDG